jgi:ankyrin repeat protein
MTWTILHEACQYERTKEVLQRSDLHSEEAIMTDDHGWTPLHIACWSNPPASVVQALVHANPSGAKEKDVHGNTPLHIASSNPESSVEVVELMLNANPSSIVMKNMEGMMPLHQACRFASQNEALVRSLIEADPTALRTRTKVSSCLW